MKNESVHGKKFLAQGHMTGRWRRLAWNTSSKPRVFRDAHSQFLKIMRNTRFHVLCHWYDLGLQSIFIHVLILSCKPFKVHRAVILCSLHR